MLLITTPPTCMNEKPAFLYNDLTPYDQIVFANAFKTALKILGKDSCWCMKKLKHSAFQGFNTSKNKLFYKGRDARPLILCLTGRNPKDQNTIIVRKCFCNSNYCLNPAHYYYGTRQDVAYEKASISKKFIDKELISKLRLEKDKGISSRKLSKTYKLPYHSVRRICNYETFDDVQNSKDKYNESKIWTNLSKICEILTSSYTDEAKKYNLNFHVTEKLECPWHNQGSNKHIGNFGMMGECLDCMSEIKKGKCTLDVREFDFRWYWQVKRFWEQVDVKGDNECWVWKGAKRKNNTESTAYFPSPFHSGKTQSAPRVAFWLSRGYTGKYRIFNNKSCEPFCCNPMHLNIKDSKLTCNPTKIKCKKLSHDNIFEYYKNKQKK